MWMPMSLPMPRYMHSPLLVSLEWVLWAICTQSSSVKLVGKSLCIFRLCQSALTCLWTPRILVCDLPEKYEKLKIDFSSTLLSLLRGLKTQFTMLSVNRHTRSLPSEGWICNFKVIWLYHLFHRSGVHWTSRCAIWSLWVFSRWGLRCQLTSMLATKVNAIVAGQTSVKAPEKAAFEAHLPKDVHILSCHSLHGPTVSPIGQPLVLRTLLCLAQELIGLPRSSFNIGPAKTPSFSWRISCAHFVLVLFTLVLTNTVL